MEIKKHVEHHLIDAYQVDRYGFLRPIMLMNLLQGAAGAHADELGAGRTYCENRGIAWVVTHNMVDIIELPKFKKGKVEAILPIGKPVGFLAKVVMTKKNNQNNNNNQHKQHLYKDTLIETLRNCSNKTEAPDRCKSCMFSEYLEWCVNVALDYAADDIEYLLFDIDIDYLAFILDMLSGAAVVLRGA